MRSIARVTAADITDMSSGLEDVDELVHLTETCCAGWGSGRDGYGHAGERWVEVEGTVGLHVVGLGALRRPGRA